MNQFRSAMVTGASGFIGSALCARLRAAGVGVYALVRRPEAARVQKLAAMGVQIACAPRMEQHALTELFLAAAPNVVFHLAAYGVNPSDREPGQMIEGNLTLLERVLVAARAAGVGRVIHTGSCYEYGESPREAGAPRPSRESDALFPISTYAAAKAGSFLYGKAWAAAHGVPFYSLRLFGVYGSGESPRRLLPYLVERLACDQAAELTDGEQVRDVLYIDDVTDAYLAAAQSPDLRPGEVYNVCSGVALSVRRLAETIADVMQKPRELLTFGRREARHDEPRWLVGDPNKLMSVTSWQPSRSLREGVSSTVEALTRERQVGVAA